jgi:hypothetical protein
MARSAQCLIFCKILENVGIKPIKLVRHIVRKHLPAESIDKQHKTGTESLKQGITIIKAKKPHTMTKSIITSPVIKEAQNLKLN